MWLRHHPVLALCNTAGNRIFQIILGILFTSTAIYLFYLASRGKGIPFAAALPKERPLWTRITAVFFLVIGSILLWSVILQLDC